MTYLYILKSKKDNSYYIGITDNIAKRIQEHKIGKVKFTKSRLPVELVYTEEYPNKSLVMRREKQLKSWKDRSLIEELIKNG